MKILAFGASNSSQSINQRFAIWAGQEIEADQLEIIALQTFEMPIYGVDREQSEGIPKEALNFKAKVEEADGIIVSLTEHNGSYTAAFKNITDWVSRIEKGTWSNKPMLLLATSPGPRGGQTVLNTAVSAFPYQGAQVSGSFSLPSFHKNFDDESGITDQLLKNDFQIQLENFKQAIQKEKETVIE